MPLASDEANGVIGKGAASRGAKKIAEGLGIAVCEFEF